MAAVIRYKIEGEVSFDPSNLDEVAEIQRELAGLIEEIRENGMLGGEAAVQLTARIHNKRNGGAEA